MTIAAVDTLIARACASTGLSDFGPGGWREGLGILVETMSAHDYGEVANGRIEARLTGVLASRLRIEDWIARHPEVLDEKIAGPVFVIGMPRTGTTALQAFLANDPQWRYLRGWEANAPVPPPELASEASDPRAVAERAALHDAGGLGQNVHIQEAGGPVDDAALLRLDFRNQELGWPAWPYTRWWRGCDMTTAYAYHARVLKLLQSRRPPNRWMVKAPWHNFHIDALARCAVCDVPPRPGQIAALGGQRGALGASRVAGHRCRKFAGHWRLCAGAYAGQHCPGDGVSRRAWQRAVL